MLVKKQRIFFRIIFWKYQWYDITIVATAKQRNEMKQAIFITIQQKDKLMKWYAVSKWSAQHVQSFDSTLYNTSLMKIEQFDDLCIK